jgi:hypothetical protein
MTKLVSIDPNQLIYTVYSGKTKVLRVKADPDRPLTVEEIELFRKGLLDFDEAPPEVA